MGDTVRVLVLGAGAMARKHAEAFRSLPGVELLAVANRSEARRDALATEYAIPNRYADYLEGIEDSGADIAAVCVPTSLHPELSIAAMESGMHVITEKPIALTLAEADRMIATSRATGRKLTVIFNRRFNTVWTELNRRIGAIGTPMVYNTQEIRSIRPKLAMHHRFQNGGPVIDCCVHDFDMLLKIFGPPRSLFATGTVFGKNKEPIRDIPEPAIDTAHITVEFRAGHTAYLLYAWGFPEGSNYWQYREFMGPDGIIRLMGEFGEEVHHYRNDGLLEVVSGLAENGHQEVIRRFLEAIRKDEPPPVDPAEAREALRIALGAMESIETGTKVEL
jgi:predicted dehydrogenase